MPTITAIQGMLRTDTLRMFRDKFLIGMSLYIFFVFLFMRTIITWLTTSLASNSGFDLIPYHPLLVSYFVVQVAPMIPGIIGGFLLLESRESGVTKALLVAPNPLSSYVSVVCVTMFAIAFLMTLMTGALIDLGLPSWPALVTIAFAAASAAPMFALLIAAVANNKVQAFAYMKLLGLGPLMVIGAYFLPEPWQWLASIYPPFLASKAYWMAEAGGAWSVLVLGGLITSAIWFGVLRRAFLAAARR